MVVGYVAHGYVVILPEDADDESIQEAVDMIMYALYYHWGREQRADDA